MSFTFSESEGHVGEPLAAQVAVISTARQGAAPIILSELIFQFNGSVREIRLSHEADGSELVENTKSVSSLTRCNLEETHSTERKQCWRGKTDLAIYPGQTKAFAFPIVFRESGDVHLTASSLQISAERFDLLLSNIVPESGDLPKWWIQAGTNMKAKQLNRDSANSIKVLPKPPKMEIRLPNLFEQYYTDEPITLDIEVSNEEDEDTEAVLEVRLLGRSKDTLGYSWAHDSSPGPTPAATENEEAAMDLPGHVVGHLAKGAKATQTIRFTAPAEPSDYALEVKVLYHVLSDRDIPISKTLIADLIFVGPFEANYEFVARLHPDPWPSYFALQENQTTDLASKDHFGIAQKWQLKAKVVSFAAEVLFVEDMKLDVQAVHGGANCITAREFEVKDTLLRPQDVDERSFCLDTQKTNLEERRPTKIDMSLDITWRRATEGAPSVTTKLPIPRVNVPGSEPRVLAIAVPSTTVDSVIHLDYVMENPTMHFLTFELSMEASEEFGFSGPKFRVLHLLPMSRQTVRFNLLPTVRGTWITPQLRVFDRYFNKTLKAHATSGMRSDKKGFSIWVYADDGDVKA